MPHSQFKVLVVDDSAEDRLFMRRMLLRSNKFVVVGEACDGQEAMDYLGHQGAFADISAHPIPDILILDLKMPKKDGYEVLRWLKEKQMPNLLVAITSGSCLAEDVNRSLELGANSYFKKTSIREEQDAIIQNLEALATAKA